MTTALRREKREADRVIIKAFINSCTDKDLTDAIQYVCFGARPFKENTCFYKANQVKQFGQARTHIYKKRLRAYIKECNDLELKAALISFVGDGKPGPGERSCFYNRHGKLSISGQIRKILINQKQITESELAQRFNVNRKSMRNKCVFFLKLSNPEDWLWVQFDKRTKVWNLVGEGKQMPDDWTGFVPFILRNYE